MLYPTIYDIYGYIFVSGRGDGRRKGGNGTVDSTVGSGHTSALTTKLFLQYPTVHTV